MNHARMKNLLCTLALTVMAGASAQTTLTPAPARTQDTAISADQQGYQTLQARIKALNDGGRPLRDRHLAQAQCWLDTSFHEYTRNDRGPWPQAALTEAESLVRAMEARQLPLPADTPLVAGAERIRADLWQRASALRGHAGWPCAQARAACGEVELVHAGHEQAQLGWRHARPYVQIAEDLIGEAEALAEHCTPRRPPLVTTAPAVVTPPAPPPTARAVAPAPVVVRDPNEVLLFAQVVFRFDRVSLGDIAVGGLVSVQDLLQRLRDDRLVLQSVQLSGHADRLNGTGRTDYNQSLSERRVASVRDFLVAQGIPADRIRLDARGDRQPRASCEALAGTALQDCLLPDRRVEVLVTTRRP
jgi:outer membrane protein OmpA-like peptidoglycan-associated protein